MKVEEHISLALLTTLRVGGPARFFAQVTADNELEDALRILNEKKLPLRALGGGSNVLVPDKGIEGGVLKIATRGIDMQDKREDVLITIAAGTSWNEVVDTVGNEGLFGIENLAGIPGTAGGAAVQNIGAYGAELVSVFEYADVIDRVTGETGRISRDKAAFGYRSSFFKAHPEIIITRIVLHLKKQAIPNLVYADLARMKARGVSLSTPKEIAAAVREIRAGKFPDIAVEGTAGSFFKNPVITQEAAKTFAARFPDLPSYPQPDGQVKISLAWILDKGLSLKGFSMGKARLFELQPLVIVTSPGATAEEVEVLAREVSARVLPATDIMIEREVETFSLR